MQQIGLKALLNQLGITGDKKTDQYNLEYHEVPVPGTADAESYSASVLVTCTATNWGQELIKLPADTQKMLIGILVSLVPDPGRAVEVIDDVHSKFGAKVILLQSTRGRHLLITR